MIEFVVFLVFTALHWIFRAVLPENFYAETMNSLYTLTVSFIVFIRFFLKINANSLWNTTRRYTTLCLCYFFMLIEGCLAVMFFGKDLQRPYEPWLSLTLASQVFMYSVTVVVVAAVKLQDFQESRDLGVMYTVLHVLDCLILAGLLVYDLWLKPIAIYSNELYLVVVECILFNLAVLNTTILRYKDYWLYRRALLKKIETLIVTNKELKLIDPVEKNLKTNKLMQTLARVLDLAPVRFVEANSIVRLTRNLLLKHGRNCKVANEICANFSSVIIINLMKRKSDFSMLPNSILKRLQKIPKKRKKNQRGNLC